MTTRYFPSSSHSPIITIMTAIVLGWMFLLFLFCATWTHNNNEYHHDDTILGINKNNDNIDSVQVQVQRQVQPSLSLSTTTSTQSSSLSYLNSSFSVFADRRLYYETHFNSPYIEYPCQPRKIHLSPSTDINLETNLLNITVSFILPNVAKYCNSSNKLNNNNKDNNNNSNSNSNSNKIRTIITYGRGNNTEGSVVIHYNDKDENNDENDLYTIIQFNYTSPKTGEKYGSGLIHHVTLSNLYAGKQRYWYRIRVEEQEQEEFVQQTGQPPLIVPVVVPLFYSQYPHFFLRGSYDDYNYELKSKLKSTSSSTSMSTMSTSSSVQLLGETPVYEFSTPPMYGQPTSIAFIGDLGQTKNSTRTMARILDAATATSTSTPQVMNDNYDSDNNGSNNDRVVTNLLIAGDLSYADGDPTRWDSWLELAEPLLRSVPFASVPGNHEIECDKITHDVFVPYESFFRNPNRIEKAIEYPPSQDYIDSMTYGCTTNSNFLGRYDYGNAYYSYRHGLVHTIMLNSYTSLLDGSLQRTWLTEIALPNVDRSITPWLIIVFHTPLYTTFKSHINEINPTLMKDSGIRQLFQRYKVNLVISGHDHAYMRTKPLNPNGSVSESKTGPIFWTLGAGGNREGHSEYINPIQQEEWVDKRDDDEFGFGLFFAQNCTHAHLQWMRDDDNNNNSTSDNAATDIDNNSIGGATSTSSVVVRDSLWIENYYLDHGVDDDNDK
jgi:hypothetical protein